MSQPTNYTPTTDFSQQEAINASGRSTVNTAALDLEFANIETTLDQTLSNLALLQRDDGRLKDVIVDVYTLAPDVLNLMGGFNLRGLWATATAYALNDICSNGAYTYLCKTAHTSGGAFDAQYWIQFGFTSGADAAAAAAAAQNSASNAATSATAAANSASAASTSATNAEASATTAATNASNAVSSASSAATSATNASNSASTAQTAAANLPNAPAAGGDKFLKTNAGGTAWEYQTAVQARASLGLGSAAILTAGTAANNVVQLTAAAKLPAVDASLLTGVVVPDASITPAKQAQPFTAGTVVAASGTSVDFTGVPSWAKRVTVVLSSLSASGTSVFMLRAGTSGGVVATGYTGGAALISTSDNTTRGTAYTTGFGLHAIAPAAANAYSGAIFLTKISGNTWVCSGGISGDAGGFNATNGAIALGAALDRVRITTANGTDTFDAGSINIMWE
jgi:hypothetical protein